MALLAVLGLGGTRLSSVEVGERMRSQTRTGPHRARVALAEAKCEREDEVQRQVSNK